LSVLSVEETFFALAAFPALGAVFAVALRRWDTTTASRAGRDRT